MPPPVADGRGPRAGRIPPRVRLQTRFLLYFTSLVLGVMIFTIGLVEARLGRMIALEAEKRALSIARSVAAVSQPALERGEEAVLAQNAMRAAREDEGIIEVVIFHGNGRIVADSDHPGRRGTFPEDPAARRAALTSRDVVVPTELSRRDGMPGVEPGLDVAVPVLAEGGRDRLGAVRLVFSTEEMRTQIGDTRLALAGVGLAAVALGVLGSLVLARRITRPLSQLVDGAMRAGAGDLETPMEVRSGDEIEELAGRFNEMVRQIRANQRAVEDQSRLLEEKVRLRTEDLSRTNEALTRAYEELQQAHSQMVHSEKMASLGQLVAGIAHEINTPSSAINAAIFNVTGYLETLSQHIPLLATQGLPPEMAERFYAIVQQALSADLTRARASTAEIRQRSRALERSLLDRGFDNPRELALTFSRLGLQDEIARVVGTAPGGATPVALAFLENVGNLSIAVSDIRVSIEAMTRMVKALKSYSHLDQAEMTDADIHDGLETTLTILQSETRYGVAIERRYARLPRVLCNTSELNQVWTNLIHNAVQAMRGTGHLVIETSLKDSFVAVRITDDGPGIAEEIRSRIFDPFFTTKDQGEGSGLGLGISQQIVQKHGGRIAFESQAGRTTFEVLLPLFPHVMEVAG
jgi:signal transduction histidine kinase